MLTISLIEPQIPQNTGNIARLCAGTKINLHLVGDLGFRFSSKQLKRAGLDYWDLVSSEYFPNKQEYFQQLKKKNFYLFTTKTKKTYYKISFQKDDYLVFGSETKGLDSSFRDEHFSRCYTIPIIEKKLRSYNLANSVAIVAFEAIRQLSY